MGDMEMLIKKTLIRTIPFIAIFILLFPFYCVQGEELGIPTQESSAPQENETEVLDNNTDVNNVIQPSNESNETDSEQIDGILDEDTSDVIEISTSNELNETDSEQIDRILDEDTSDVVDAEKTFCKGDSGEEVLRLQQRLAALKYLTVSPDGSFGNQTEEALKVFELYNGFPIDGEVDCEELELLSTSNVEAFRYLRVGEQNRAIINIQLYLQKQGYLPSNMECNGSFENTTKVAVILFQVENGLQNPDGIVGNWTARKMVNNATSMQELSQGTRGVAVYVVQDMLRKYGFLTVRSDGIFGIMTRQAIASFQLFNGLDISGTMDLSTALRLFGDSVETYTTLRIGNQGNVVLRIQNKMKELGFLADTVTPDGIYGNLTYAAITMFQAYSGLQNPDGLVGKLTADKLANSPAVFSLPKPDSEGDDVYALQLLLQKAGYLPVNPDGIFGAYTETAVKVFQVYNGLEVTGTVDYDFFIFLCGNNTAKKFVSIKKVIPEILFVCFSKSYMIAAI